MGGERRRPCARTGPRRRRRRLPRPRARARPGRLACPRDRRPCHGGAADAIDTRAICLARETLARHDGLADFAFAMQGLGSGAISLAGSDEQKSAYLPRVARGEKIAAFALSEPDAGSMSPRCNAPPGPTATATCSTERRRGSATGASPISMSCSHAPASQVRSWPSAGRKASPPSSWTPACPAFPSPSASTSSRRTRSRA